MSYFPEPDAPDNAGWAKVRAAVEKNERGIVNTAMFYAARAHRLRIVRRARKHSPDFFDVVSVSKPRAGKVSLTSLCTFMHKSDAENFIKRAQANGRAIIDQGERT